jgi:hypothetical protein
MAWGSRRAPCKEQALVQSVTMQACAGRPRPHASSGKARGSGQQMLHGSDKEGGPLAVFISAAAPPNLQVSLCGGSDSSPDLLLPIPAAPTDRREGWGARFAKEYARPMGGCRTRHTVVARHARGIALAPTSPVFAAGSCVIAIAAP